MRFASEACCERAEMSLPEDGHVTLVTVLTSMPAGFFCRCQGSSHGNPMGFFPCSLHINWAYPTAPHAAYLYNDRACGGKKY